MDNSILIYIVIFIFVMLLMIAISYIVLLNYFDETSDLYINDISKKITDYINLFDMNTNKISKKLYNEMKYINEKLINIIDVDNKRILDYNKNIIKDITNIDPIYVGIILLLVISVLISGISLSKSTKNNNTISKINSNSENNSNGNNNGNGNGNQYGGDNVDISLMFKNISICVVTSMFFLTIINNIYLYYVRKNIINIDMKDILINLLEKMKGKIKDINK